MGQASTGLNAAGDESASALLIIDMVSTWRFDDAEALRAAAMTIAPVIARLKQHIGTPLQLLLQHLHVHHLILTGVLSDQCVLFTAAARLQGLVDQVPNLPATPGASAPPAAGAALNRPPMAAVEQIPDA